MAEVTSAPTPVGADDKLRSSRAQGLTVEIVDGRLVMSIGIDALAIAIRGGDDFDEEQHVITDADELAASIARGLEDEQEDGTTRVHLAIDSAFEWAFENGEPGVEFITDQIGEDDAS